MTAKPRSTSKKARHQTLGPEADYEDIVDVVNELVLAMIALEDLSATQEKRIAELEAKLR